MKKGGGRRNCHKRKDAEITEKNVLGRQIAQKVFFPNEWDIFLWSAFVMPST
jgi:hypothetical protein